MASQSPSEANFGPRLDIATAILASFATVTIGTRLLARNTSSVKLWYDDWFAILSVVFAWAEAACTFWGVSHGLGKPQDALTADDLTSLLKQELMVELTYACAIPCVKLSILLLLLRVFPTRGVRISVWTIGSVIVAWWITVVLVSIFSCSPVSFQWNRQLDGKCIDTRKFFLGNVIPNIITDVAVLILPMPLIWNLQVPVRRKIATSLLFTLGAFVVITSIVRITYIYDADETKWNYDLAVGSLWLNMEVTFGIICACIPASMPLFRRFYEKIDSKYGSRKSTTNIKNSSLPPHASSRVARVQRGSQDDAVHLVQPKSRGASRADAITGSISQNGRLGTRGNEIRMDQLASGGDYDIYRLDP